jgi:hypothetical protein
MRPAGSARWRGAGTIEWGVGLPPPVLLDPQERRDPLERDPLPAFSPRDTIDGRPASLWQFYSSGRYLTGVRFDEPRVFITGVAGNEGDRALHQAVYRTVRFR